MAFYLKKSSWLLRKNKSNNHFVVSATSTRFRFHVTKVIMCDRTCQRSVTIINKEKSFSPNTSPLNQYFLLIFLFEWKLSKRFIWACKNLNYGKTTLFSVADTLANKDCMLNFRYFKNPRLTILCACGGLYIYNGCFNLFLTNKTKAKIEAFKTEENEVKTHKIVHNVLFILKTSPSRTTIRQTKHRNINQNTMAAGCSCLHVNLFEKNVVAWNVQTMDNVTQWNYRKTERASLLLGCVSWYSKCFLSKII